MKKTKNPSLVNLVVFLIFVSAAVYCSVSIEAKKHNGHHRKSRGHKHQHHKHRSSGGGAGSGSGDSGDGSTGHYGDNVPGHAPSPAPSHEYYPNQTNIFDILSFGAKGDGATDDSKALESAWKAACQVGWATIAIPSEFKFLIKPTTLQGPCKPNIVLQIDGTLLAPPKVSSWPKSSLFQWINFKWIQNFTIQGTGTVDGQGSAWWSLNQLNYIQKNFKYIPDMKPTALRFFASFDITVRDITIVNSPLCHLKFDNSGSINVNNITISSPENSPNTDGIHLQNTQNVEIQHSNIGCGDDCVSIQTGCSNVHVHHINCGPGHGISLGSLGKDKTSACVKDIVIENITMQSTMYGVRIKTWQGGIGVVKNVTFSDIQVTDVSTPIMIDQFYCDKHKCKNQTEAIAIKGVKYNRIVGTYDYQPIHLACSNNVPCTEVDLIDIKLEQSTHMRGLRQALCWNSYGQSRAPLVPSSIDYCLRRGGPYKRPAGSSHEHSC